MPDTPLTEAALDRIEAQARDTIRQWTEHDRTRMAQANEAIEPPPSSVLFATAVVELLKENRRLRADLEQAAKDYAQVYYTSPIFKADPDWLKRVREREGKNG